MEYIKLARVGGFTNASLGFELLHNFPELVLRDDREIPSNH